GRSAPEKPGRPNAANPNGSGSRGCSSSPGGGAGSTNRVYGPRRASFVRSLRESCRVVAVGITGVSGLVGRALTDRLLGQPHVSRLVGIDVREPPHRFHGVEFHLADVAHGDLRPLLEGCDVVVHLASIVDPIGDDALMARVNVDGTRRVLEAVSAVGVSKVVRVSTTPVYGAWPGNAVPLTEDAPLRPNPGFSPAVQAAE